MAGLLPVLLEARSGPLVAGALVALEGVFALVVPGIVGPLTDRAGGKRLPFMAAAGLLAVGGLTLMAVGGPLWVLVVGLVLYQVAYFAYLTPYYALYPDLVEQAERGRSQGAQGAWREVGLGVGFVAGPALLGLWRPAPFLLAAAVVLVVTPLFGAAVARAARERGPSESVASARGGSIRGLLRAHPEIAWFVVANGLWETALAALRAFVVLFLIVGLGKSEVYASAVLGVVVVAALVAAPLAGWLSDRLGRRRVLTIALWVYAVGMVTPALTQSAWLLPVVFAGALAAVTVMTLPYALLMDLLPEGDHGSGAGLFGVSRGLGLLAGPLLAGLAITLLDGVFADTDGYAAIFVVAALALLASLPALRAIGRSET